MKKLVTLVLSGAMAFSLAGCGSSKKTSNANATKTNSDTSTLFINLASEPDKLDPALNTTVDGAALAVNSFVGLLTYGKDGKLKPALAKAMPTVSEDGKTYTVELKESKWSDGTELTAKDFVYSWNRAVNPKTASDYSYLFDVVARAANSTDANPVLDVTAEGDYKLVIKLNAPTPYFDQLLAFPVFMPVPQAAVEKANPNGDKPGAWAQEAGFVSNGAYTLTKWKHNESMTYEKNDNYYDAKNVSIKKLNFMLSADDTATYAAYKSGDLDFIDGVPNDELKNVLKSKELKTVDQLGTYYIGFNVNSDLFSGMTPEQATSFRKGVSDLIDRKYIVDTVGQTGQVPAGAFVPKGMHDGNGKVYKSNYFDATKTGSSNIEQAKKDFKAAGLEVKNGKDKSSFKVTKNGQAITIPYMINTNTGHQKVAECIQQDLAVAGIKVNIDTEEWNVFIQDRKDGKFTVAREGWVADYDDPINMLEIFSTKSGNNDVQLGKGNSTAAPNWKHYDELINKIYSSTDNAERAKLLHEAEKELMATYAAVPIYFYNDIYMQKSNVTGVYSTVFGNKYFMYAKKTK